MKNMNTPSRVWITSVVKPGSICTVTFCCLSRRIIDSTGPPPCTAPRATSKTNWVKNPSTRVASVAIIATAPLKNVLNITPKLVTSSICTQMPR